MTIADCFRVFWAGTDRIREDVTVLVTLLPGSWPDVTVSARSPGSRIARLLGSPQDLVTGDRTFDRRFAIETSDPDHAAVLFTPAVIAGHLDGSLRPWSLWGGELLITERHRYTELEPVDVLKRAAQLCQVAAALGHSRTPQSGW